jgi:hypothetical protein
VNPRRSGRSSGDIPGRWPRPEALLPASVSGSYLPPYPDEAPSRFCLPVQMVGGVFGLQAW